MTLFKNGNPEQPILKPADPGEWILQEDFWYEWIAEGLRQRIVVRQGFLTDIASVPVWARWLVSVDGEHRAAAIVHDWLYAHQGSLPPGAYWVHRPEDPAGPWIESRARWTRLAADRIFCRILREYGVPRWKRRLMFRAVRVGGGLYWWT